MELTRRICLYFILNGTFQTTFPKRKSLLKFTLPLNTRFMLSILLKLDQQIFFIVTHHHPKTFPTPLPKTKRIIGRYLTHTIFLNFRTSRKNKIRKRINEMISKIRKIILKSKFFLIKSLKFTILYFKLYLACRYRRKINTKILHNKIKIVNLNIYVNNIMPPKKNKYKSSKLQPTLNQYINN